MAAVRFLLTSDAEARAVLRRLGEAGFRLHAGFVVPADQSPSRVVLHGRISNQRHAEQVVRAAALGAGVVAVADPTTTLARTLLAELRVLGPVQLHPDRSDTVAPLMPDEPVAEPNHAETTESLALLPEQRALLERLANGQTIAAAAAAEYLSLRTANRRIANARTVLGVRTTREAVLKYLRQRPPTE